MYNYGQQNNNPILNPQAPAGGSSGGGLGSYFGGIWNGIKNIGGAILNQATGKGTSQAPASTYNEFGTPSNYNFNTPTQPAPAAAATPTDPHFSTSHSVTTKTGPDGSTTQTTTPVPQQAPTNYGQSFVDTQGNPGVAKYDSATGQPLANVAGSTTQTPPSPFYVDTTGNNNTYDSSALGGGTSYDAIMRKRDLAEAQYQQNYQDYLTKQTGYHNLVNMDKAAENSAGFTGETVDYGQGAAGIAARNNAMKELAASSALNTAGVPLAVAQNALDYQNTNLTNFYNSQGNLRANAPQFSGQTVNQSTGDIYGFVRDPITGNVSTKVMGNVYNGSYGSGSNGGSGGGTSNLSPLIAPYTAQSLNGDNYINSDRVPANQKDAIQIQAAQAGVPFLTTEEVAKVRAIDQTSQNLTNIQGTIQAILKPGIVGRGLNSVINPIKDFLQTDTNISSFDSYRTAAINAIQALGGGSGSGFRLTQSEIDTATKNLPTITDNLETAQAKIQKMQTYLSQWSGELFPNQSSGKSSGGSSVPSGAGLYNF